MEQRKSKSILILAFLLTSLAAYLHAHLIWLSAIPMMILLVVSFWRRSRTAFIGLVMNLSLLYPLTSSGLYGRDSHGAAWIAHKISKSGWPVQTMVAWGDPSTPLLHFHTAIVHVITGLDILPYSIPPILLTKILPIIYVLATLILIYILSRRFVSLNHRLVYLTPVFLYLPFYGFYTGFRRASLGLLLLMLAIYGTLMYVSKSDERYLAIFVLCAFAIPLVHRAASINLLLFLSAVVFAEITVGRSQLINDQTEWMSASSLLLIYGAIWVAIMLRNKELFERIATIPLLLFYSANVEESLGYLPQQGTDSSVSLYQYLQSTGPLFATAIIACIFSIIVVYQLYQRDLSTIDTALFLYSVVLGSFAAISYFGPSMIAHSRLLSVFIVTAAWLPLSLLGKLTKSTSVPRPAIVSVILVLILLPSATLNPQVLTGKSTVEYAGGGGQIGQQFNKTDYSNAVFMAKYAGSGTIVGDANVQEVMTPITQRQISGNPKPLLSGGPPAGTYVVLADRNKVVFKAPYNRQWIAFAPKSPFQRLDRNSSAIYSSGTHRVWREIENETV